jgi:phosphate transport system protein
MKLANPTADQGRGGLDPLRSSAKNSFSVAHVADWAVGAAKRGATIRLRCRETTTKVSWHRRRIRGTHRDFIDHPIGNPARFVFSDESLTHSSHDGTSRDMPTKDSTNTFGSETALSRHALRDQAALWDNVLKLADAVGTMLTIAVEALIHGRPDLAEEVKEREQAIDGWEVRIEQECLRVLALYEPVASDLRRLGGLLRINNDLERISNLARNIAKRVKKLVADPEALALPESLKILANGTLEHVRKSLDGLATIDTELARDVIAHDGSIDGRFRAVRAALKDDIRRDPDRLDTWLRLINCARDLERIADHAVNIARSVVFMKEGDIIRHAGSNRRP